MATGLLGIPVRYVGWLSCLGAGVVLGWWWWQGHGWAAWGTVGACGLFLIGWRDLRQTKRAVLRNYPVIGHIRYLLEYIRPEIRQYFIEGDRDTAPFPASSAPWSTNAPRATRTSAPSARNAMSRMPATSGSTIPCARPSCPPTTSAC